MSPVKKRVKESSPHQQQQQQQQNEQYRRRNSPHHWQQGQQHFNSNNPRCHRQPTITIEDTPSPAVSVITISDSDDEGTSNQKANGRGKAPAQLQQRNRAVVSCVTVPDSDEEHRSPIKGHQPRQQQYPSANSYVVREIKPEPASSSYSGASLSQKKRLLAKAQTECTLLSKPKQEQILIGSDGYSSAEYGSSGDRSSMAQQPCDFSTNGLETMHFQSVIPPANQQTRGYRSEFDHQQRDYLQPPAAHRQQRFDMDTQQPREQNGFYTHAGRTNRNAHLSPQPGPSSRHQQQAAVLAAAVAAAGQPLYHQPDLFINRRSLGSKQQATGGPHSSSCYLTGAPQPASTAVAAYLSAGQHHVSALTSSTIPPPAHSSRAAPVLSGAHHTGHSHHSHPLPAHLQPSAVFQAHPQMAAAVGQYAYASLNSPGKAQYQHIWFPE